MVAWYKDQDNVPPWFKDYGSDSEAIESDYYEDDPPKAGSDSDPGGESSDTESEPEDKLFPPVVRPVRGCVADTTFAYDLSRSKTLVDELQLPTKREILCTKKIDQIIKNCRTWLAAQGENPACYTKTRQLPDPQNWPFETFVRKGKVLPELKITDKIQYVDGSLYVDTEGPKAVEDVKAMLRLYELMRHDPKLVHGGSRASERQQGLPFGLHC